MTSIDQDQFSDRVYDASKAAFSALIRENPTQSFYTFGLFTDDSLQFVHPVANTEEALEATVRRYRATVDPKYGITSTRTGMRWSYGDWGFFPYQDGGYFDEINRILELNFDQMIADEEFDGAVVMLWNSLITGLSRLESESFFGSGPERSKFTVMIVGDLPTDRVNSWVSALNPKDVADRYLNWNPDASDDVLQ